MAEHEHWRADQRDARLAPVRAPLLARNSFSYMVERMSKPGDPTRVLSRRTSVASKVPALTEVLRGTLRERFVRCGKPGCHCEKGRGHGPFVYLSVTLGVGRTAQITIAAEDQAVARRMVRNYARVQKAIESISTINRELLKQRVLPRAGPSSGEAAKPPQRRGKAT